MRLKKFLLSLAAISLVANTLLAISGNGRPGTIASGNGSTTINSMQLSSAEIDTLLFMREEEKVARDVYLEMYALWQHPVFSNIASSEQNHMDAVAALLDKYNLADPVVDDSVGVFTNDRLFDMYQELVLRGQVSLTEALYSGAYIEETDIRDLENAIARTRHNDIVNVYENLLSGSRNHLRAFVGQIEALGIAYEAQVLLQWEVDLILSEPMERTGSLHRGR